MGTPFAHTRRLWVGSLLAICALMAVLAWLGWQIAAQDEQLATARRAAAAENTADLTVATLEQRLVGVEQDLAQILQGGSPIHPPGESDAAVFAHFAVGSARAWPADHLAFVPDEADAPAPAAPALADVDALQFIHHDYHGALALLRRKIDDDAPHEAIYVARMAQNYRAANQPRAALAAYQRLSMLRGPSIAGMPLEVAGLIGSLTAAEDSNDGRIVRAAAERLDAGLAAVRWQLTASTYDYLEHELASRWTGRAPMPAAGIRFADALTRVWADRHDEAASSGRVTVDATGGPLLVVWRAANGQMAGYAADAAFVHARWLGTPAATVAISAPDGRPLAGPKPDATTHYAVRLASDTKLPWTVRAAAAVDPQEVAVHRTRRRLLGAGISVMLAVTLLCAAIVGRAVTRELAVARLQSDFVSAVSHEFRTPLTTLCQLSELLEAGRVPDETVRRSYYGYLRTESERLRRLVERLLTFGRLREGRAQFRVDRLDAVELTRGCVAAFSRAQPGRHRISMTAPDDAVDVSGDADALGCALWNLLENAVKYSPAGTPVRVQVERRNRRVAISVTDAGPGVHPSERQHIFERFVRGRAAEQSAVGGTGIGLATVREIMRAHGGEIAVDSDGKNGSTFTLLLPARI